MSNARRGFLKTLSLSIGAIAGAPALLRAMPQSNAPEEKWLEGLHGKHKQFFDVGLHTNGNPLNRAAAFLNVYNNAYGLKDSDVNVIFGAHGSGLSFVFNDTLWSTYKLGAHWNIEDPTTKAPSVRSLWSGVGSQAVGDESVVGLQKRGVRFIACQTAMNRLSKQLAAKSGEPQPQVFATLEANLVPGVIPVPGMIAAVNRAQEAGLTYVYVG